MKKLKILLIVYSVAVIMPLCAYAWYPMAPASSGNVTNGDSHDHNGGDGAQIDHTNLSNIGTNTHAEIDTALGNKPNSTQVPLDSDFTSNGYMRVTGSGTYESCLDTFNGTSAPTANEDSGDGYCVGSFFYDVTNDKAYVCLDATATAAVWTEITQTAAGLSENEVEEFIFDTDVETATGIWTLNRIKLTVHTAEPTDEAVGDVLIADNDTWDPASVSGTNDYMVICTAAGSPGTWLAIRDMVTGEMLYSALEIPNTSSGDQTLTEGQIGQKSDEDVICFHGGSAGEAQDEVCLSLLDPFIVPFDPKTEYDTTDNHVISIHKVGDAEPHGITLVEWSCDYINGDPDTELDLDLICDSTPNWNPDANATVMDVLDTTAGTSSADSGFDSATCGNGNYLYLRFGADPTDSGERVHCEFLFYKEED